MPSKQPTTWLRDGRIQRKWTPEEDAELRRLRALDITFDDIGKRLDRSGNSCISRAQKLGLSTKRSAPSLPKGFAKS